MECNDIQVLRFTGKQKFTCLMGTAIGNLPTLLAIFFTVFIVVDGTMELLFAAVDGSIDTHQALSETGRAILVMWLGVGLYQVVTLIVVIRERYYGMHFRISPEEICQVMPDGQRISERWTDLREVTGCLSQHYPGSSQLKELMLMLIGFPPPLRLTFADGVTLRLSRSGAPRLADDVFIVPIAIIAREQSSVIDDAATLYFRNMSGEYFKSYKMLAFYSCIPAVVFGIYLCLCIVFPTHLGPVNFQMCVALIAVSLICPVFCGLIMYLMKREERNIDS
jgi:hypothetical protein